jgi:hypothetical protein
MTAIFTSSGLLPSLFVAEEEEIRALLRAERATVPVGLAFVAVVLEADHTLPDGSLRLGSLAPPTLVVHGPLLSPGSRRLRDALFSRLRRADEFDSSLETLL